PRRGGTGGARRNALGRSRHRRSGRRRAQGRSPDGQHLRDELAAQGCVARPHRTRARVLARPGGLGGSAPQTLMRSVAIVTAAGSAERFGGRKLLTPIDGEPLLDHTIRALRDGGVSEVIVVVGSDARAEIERDVNAMLDARVRPVENPDPSRGMFSSIQEGVAQAQGDLLLVLPGDMPFVSPETVRSVIARYAERPAIVSPRYRGKRGHPVALPIALRDEIGSAHPHGNLHDVIKRHTELRVALTVVVRDIICEDVNDA